MKLTAICVGSIYDRDRFLIADRLVRQRTDAGEHVILLPL